MPTPADIRHRDDGFTLVELLIGITVSLVVLLATLTSLDAFSSNAAHQTRVTSANDRVRSVMDATVTDLRGASVILRASADDLAYSVPAASGTRIERLCVSSDRLYGSSTTTSGTPAAPTAACDTGTKLANLSSSTTGTAFTYDGAASSATPAKVKNVGLTFSLDASGAGKTAASTLQASAARRAAGTLPLTDDDLVPVCNSAGALLTLSVSAGGSAAVGPLTVTYATTAGVSLGQPTGTTLQIPEGITRVVATVTDALGATNTIEKDVECN